MFWRLCGEFVESFSCVRRHVRKKIATAVSVDNNRSYQQHVIYNKLFIHVCKSVFHICCYTCYQNIFNLIIRQFCKESVSKTIFIIFMVTKGVCGRGGEGGGITEGKGGGWTWILCATFSRTFYNHCTFSTCVTRLCLLYLFNVELLLPTAHLYCLKICYRFISLKIKYIM